MRAVGASSQRISEACRRALLLDPQNRQAWVRLGSAHYALGEKKRASEAYLRALELGPDDLELQEFLKERRWLQK